MHLTAFARAFSCRSGLTHKWLRVMKLTAIILLSACLTATAKSGAQRISLHEQNAELTEVFKSIRQQTGYLFVYDVDMVKQAKRITVHIENASLEEALNACFKDQPLSYTIVEKTIVVKKKLPKDDATIPELTNEPPPIDITGRVVDSTGTPLPGASIRVRGTKLGTTTDANGNFTLKGVDENAMLEISFSGYRMVTVRANNTNALATVVLKVDVRETDAVIVNTGYQQLKPNEVTGSVVVITKEQLDQRVAPDIISKLEGITNGLVFNKAVLDGKNELRVRGESTMFAYTEPLIVVDNFPYEGAINDLNPNDVESITILKDAAAASIWGSQAGNGVIVITTRKGKANQPLRLEMNVNTTITEKPYLFQTPIIGPSDFIDLETLLFSKGKYGSTLNSVGMTVVSPVVEILDQRRRGIISAADSASRIDALRRNDWRNEYLKHVYQSQVSNQYQVNLSGGSSKINYYFSAGFDRTKASAIGNSSNRITFLNQTSYRPIKNLEIQVGLGYAETTSTPNGINSGIIPNQYPYMRLTDDNGNYLSIPQRRAIFEDTIANHGFLDWKYYPLRERELKDVRHKDYVTRVSTAVKYTLIKGLNIDASYQYMRSNTIGRTYVNPKSYEIRNYLNRYAIVTNGNYTGSNYPEGGRLDVSNSNILSHNGRVKLDYSKKWGFHAISSIAGFEVRENKTEQFNAKYLGYNDENGSFIIPTNSFTTYTTYPSGSGTIAGESGPSIYYSGTIRRYRSYFANASYIFNDKYGISASARLDQANLFGVKTNLKGKPLWSVGAKWDISKEKFYKFGGLPNLSLRVTYGYNGNVSPDLAAIVTLRYQGNASYTGLPYSVISNVPNPELRWEKTGHLNIGVNFSSKNSRISGSLEYFRKNGVDLIGSTPIDPTTGVSTVDGNFSNMQSKGIDLSLNTINLDTKIKWTTSFIFNYASEKVTRYDVPTTGIRDAFKGSVKPVVGYPVRSVFSYRWAGLDPLTGGPLIILGDTINRSYSNATINAVTFKDYVYNGRYNPPIVGAVLNRVSWQGWSLTFNVTYKLGHYFRRQTVQYVNVGNASWDLIHKDFLLRWQKPGDEQFTNVPSFVYPISTSEPGRTIFYENADILIEKADHIRLQFVNINYSLPSLLIKRLKLQRIDVYFYANNLGILWRANKLKIDPDYPYLNYPPSRTYSFGIKVGI